MSRSRLNAIVLSVVAATLAAGVTACAPRIERHGNVPDADMLRRIEVGVSSREEVGDWLGTPSSTATFGEDTWYYITARTERYAFYAPSIVEQQVVAIAFDDADVVRSVRGYGLEDAREIEPVDRLTPTGGKKLTVLQQMLGNFGRIARTSPPGN